MDLKPVYLVLILHCVQYNIAKKHSQQVNNTIRGCFESADEEVDNNLDDDGEACNSSTRANAAVRGLEINIHLSNGSISLAYEDIEGEERKMKTSVSNTLQYMLVPSFVMSGLLPWVIPKLQMVVMVVSMVNNMVFSSALFSLVRSYVFDKEPEEHIVYVNQGYKNRKPSS